MSDPTSTHLKEQSEYYRARASEYDEWWFRNGRYNQGAALNAQWFGEIRTVAAMLEAKAPLGRVLELACGTGNWTRELARLGSEVTALDASPEMLEINARKVLSSSVRYIQTDLFAWTPDARYDFVFFGFWLSHVPEDLFVGFWEFVRRCLRDDGRVFFVDSLSPSTGTAADHCVQERGTNLQRRQLNDGREFQVYKIYYDPANLTERLRGLGWDFDVLRTDQYFIYGSGRLASAHAA